MSEAEEKTGQEREQNEDLEEKAPKREVAELTSPGMSEGEENTRQETEEMEDFEASSDQERTLRQSQLAELSPPVSRGEAFRDWLLNLLDGWFFQALGVVVLILVIADGALFFFFLMGWQSLCRPRTDCHQRNQIYNISVQVLNVLFSYMCTVSMPWRCTNFIHIVGAGCPWRSNEEGRDLYGIPTKDIWFYVPLRRRLGVTIVLLWNCLFQYGNQATRIVYYSFDLQNERPGNIWTNVFFFTSMLCAAIGGGWQVYEERKVRNENPGEFPPGPIEMMAPYFGWCCCYRDKNEDEPSGHGEAEEDPPIYTTASRLRMLAS